MHYLSFSLPEEDVAVPHPGCVIASSSLSEHQAMELDFASKELQKAEQGILGSLFQTTIEELPPVLKRRDWTLAPRNESGLSAKCAARI
jgi:hypothetical protein